MQTQSQQRINDRLEILILKSLFHVDEYCRKVIPYIKKDYFDNDSEKIIYQEFKEFYDKYNTQPTIETVTVALSKKDNIREDILKESHEALSACATFADKDNLNIPWLLKETEDWAKSCALYQSALKMAEIIQDKKKPKGKILDIINEALAVNFDSYIGHSYLDDAEKRFDFYHTKEDKYPFNLDYFDRITSGGVNKKTLNVLLAGTAVGKSLAMCHFAANYLMQGINVLYITLEMSEERIAERIDANLLNIPINDIRALSRDMFVGKVQSIRNKTQGKLVIKEYPTSCANVSHFRALLQELKSKKKFIPQVIFIDYLNIASSLRQGGNEANSYNYVKSIAEELRGLAVENEVPIWTATQLNRTGYVSSDVGLENTSESFGVPATADFMVAMTTNEDFDANGYILVKQLKNRYNDSKNPPRFIVGVDKPKMRLFDVDISVQDTIVDTSIGGKGSSGGKGKVFKKSVSSDEPDDDSPAFDKTDFGNRVKDETKSKYGNKKFTKLVYD